jgi:hypothetical protein
MEFTVGHDGPHGRLVDGRTQEVPHRHIQCSPGLKLKAALRDEAEGRESDPFAICTIWFVLAVAAMFTL